MSENTVLQKHPVLALIENLEKKGLIRLTPIKWHKGSDQIIHIACDEYPDIWLSKRNLPIVLELALGIWGIRHMRTDTINLNKRRVIKFSWEKAPEYIKLEDFAKQ